MVFFDLGLYFNSFTLLYTWLLVVIIEVYVYVYVHACSKGGHYIGNCTPTRNWGQSEVKRSRQNFGASQAVKVGIGGSSETVKGFLRDQWAWLMPDCQGSRPDFRCSQGVKGENLMG